MRTLTSHIALVEQELLTFPEHLSSPMNSGVRIARSLDFCVVLCGSLLVPFRTAIVLSVLLRFTATDCPLSSNFSHCKRHCNFN
jgi:hypothetical protein